MRFPYAILGLASIAGCVLADGAAIVEALEIISDDTVLLNNTVTSWTGEILGTLPIITESASLLIDINNGTQTAEYSAALTDTETFDVAITVAGLITATNTTLTNIINTKPKFDKLLLSPVIYLTLASQKDASNKLSAAIAKKVPATFTDAAEQLGATLSASFDVALKAYSLL